MTARHAISSLKNLVPPIEWRLLGFLVLFLDVKLAVKLLALVLVYILQPNFRFGFKFRHSRLPLFYLVVIVIAVFNFIIYRDFSASYSFVALSALLSWTACILAIHQVKLFAEKTDVRMLNNTLLAFFALNIFFSFLNLGAIMMEIGLRNPFRYQGEYQKYFINSGDYIKGISFDTSTTNAVINCFGIVYFLYQKKYRWLLAAMVTLIMTASNFSNILLLLFFTGLFIFKSSKEQKVVMVICTLFLVIFFARLSPQNDSYANGIVSKFLLKKKPANEIIPEKVIPIRERPDSLLTPETRKEQIATLFLDSLEREKLKRNPFKNKAPLQWRPPLPEDRIHTAFFQGKRDTSQSQQQLISYMKQHLHEPAASYEEAVPGKILAYKQSISFLKDHPAKIIAGTGAGNFSSKLAFRATGLKMAGGFPAPLDYCNTAFLNNHLQLYAHYFSSKTDYHSIIHNPDSVYDQLLTEYGLLGLLAFSVYYIGFFLRPGKKLSYGLPLLLMLLAFFMVNYWFEQLSVVVLFELMLFINIKECALIKRNERH